MSASPVVPLGRSSLPGLLLTVGGMRVQRCPRRDRRSAGRTDAARSGRVRHGVLERRTDGSSARAAEVTVHVSRRRPRPLLTVSGALDESGASLLTAMLEHVWQTESRTLEVDLAQVDYADSHGVAPLLDGRVAIRQASPIVKRLFEALNGSLPHLAAGQPPRR